MFDIFELDEFVYSYMESNEIAMCSYVCKKWHRCATPIIWRHINVNRLMIKESLGIFVELIEDDMHQEQNPKDFTQPSVLSTRGRLIKSISSRFPTSEASTDVVAHFFKRCPHVQVQFCGLEKADFEESEELDKILKAVVPATRHLWIGYDKGDTSQNLEESAVHITVLDLISVLSATSSALEALTLNIDFEQDECSWEEENASENDEPEVEDVIKSFGALLAPSSTNDNSMKPQGQGQPKDATVNLSTLKLENLKELTIGGYDIEESSHDFWDTLWLGCQNLKSLAVHQIEYAEDIGVRNAIGKYMQNLDTLEFGILSNEMDQFDDEKRERKEKDKQIAAMISSGNHKWRVIRLYETFGPRTLSALASHCSTVQEVSLGGTVKAQYLITILSNCPNLRKLETLHDGVSCYTHVLDSVFADWDDTKKVFKPWKCESSLRVLKVGLWTDPVKRQDHTTKALERIARLKNLEVLWFGRRRDRKEEIDCYSAEPDYSDEEDEFCDEEMFFSDEDDDEGLESMRLSFDKGFKNLAALSKLSEFNIAAMHHRMGQDEYEWLLKQFPKLNFKGNADQFDFDHDRSPYHSDEDHYETDSYDGYSDDDI
ncbi:hypothetical protein BG004_000354 [Podila humilis]|nr:hypothetical protein BG004_000354 [Podila humilis]